VKGGFRKWAEPGLLSRVNAVREYQRIAGDIKRLHLPSYRDQGRDNILDALDFNGDKLEFSAATLRP
jgi:hypothetical protein